VCPSLVGRSNPMCLGQWCLWSHADLSHCLMRASDTVVLHGAREDISVSHVTPKPSAFSISFNTEPSHTRQSQKLVGFLCALPWGLGEGSNPIPADEVPVARRTHTHNWRPAGSRGMGNTMGLPMGLRRAASAAPRDSREQEQQSGVRAAPRYLCTP